MKQMLVPGHTLRLPGEAWGQGISGIRSQKTGTGSTCRINPGGLFLKKHEQEEVSALDFLLRFGFRRWQNSGANKACEEFQHKASWGP